MLHLIKKDFQLLSRSRSELMQLLLMPLLLIAILGFALGDLLSAGFSIEPFSVAVVEEQTEAEAVETFENHLMAIGMGEAERTQLLAVTDDLNPRDELFNVLESDEVSEWVTISEMSSRTSAEEALEEGEVEGVIVIPEGFSVNLWKTVLLNERAVSGLDLALVNFQSVPADILRSITRTFVDRFNLELSIALALEGEEETAAADNDYGEIVSLNAAEPITSFQYYTVGMGMMFALYTAPALASRAYKEKEQHVFGRLIVSGTRPINYLLSKLVSGMGITFVQVAILFGLSTLIFGTFSGRNLSFWLDTGLATLVLAFVVGAITSLLTSITLYSNSDASASTFDGLIVTLFAFIGGSFTPVEQFSESLKTLGNWTPNGAMMTSYLQLLQGFSLAEVSSLMVRVVIMAVVLAGMSIVIFPKRRLD
ncbi:ABC-2 type transport system permease protein [Alkalibacterium putridalgicola]|uniref:ABC transporter (ATP-binding protein) -streptolysin S associated ORF n=1 Tax=Alkalibacterium putridalgicola TaxID=426703 RepID=A0A1H7TH90_9LACT|nr:ABC transporter permease [Alkalibacterium putridalgicola]GEK89466.1 ABC transporter (ATP-binding protein) - streptolysin S associated ORF [Alkalibacterium putridalgicola]SEL83925.1 ABC-2 type transport system permease protein [Alkalibacterium putridalgicola]